VLGSKNIKAIAVRGSRRVEWAHPRELTALSRSLSQRSFGPATAKYRELGTATNLLTFNRLGALPTRNFQSGAFAEAAEISPEQLTATRSKTRESCVTCTIGCEHIYALGKNGGVRVEYENLFALGSLCGVSDSDAVLRASQRCDELGLDTISAGGTIAFAMECVERGWLDQTWLRFGDGQAMLRAIELIGAREGLGNLLAEGSRCAARRSDMTASTSRRRSRAWRFRAMNRERCRPWHSASPSVRAARTTIAAAPTKSIFRIRWIAGTLLWTPFAMPSIPRTKPR
jgi:aldehyde:ferredoxin oxidoreductase